MVRKQVPSLRQKTVAFVNEQISKFVYQHWDSNCVFCTVSLHPEDCQVMRTAKKHFMLPLNITQEVYSFTSYGARRTRLTAQMKHLFCFLLHHSVLDMGDFVFRNNDDLLFLMKYGKNITSLEFTGEVCEIEESIVKAILTVLWRPILSSACNIKKLDLNYKLILTDYNLQIIGSECIQLETFIGFELDSTITEKSFEKLCFSMRGSTQIMNNCCNTLKKIEIQFTEDSNTTANRQNEILHLLLLNIRNLRSFVNIYPVDIEDYLDSMGANAVLDTSLEEVFVIDLTKDLILLLKSFSPNMKLLIFESLEECAFEALNDSFPNLEMLKFADCTSDEEDFDLSEVTIPLWSNLKVLKLCMSRMVLDFSRFAKHLPVLEELKVCHCVELEWDGITCFKSLADVNLKFQGELLASFYTLASFATTVQSLTLDTSIEGAFDCNVLSVLCEVPFPDLKCLDVSNLVYDVDFIINIIKHCPLLENFVLFNKSGKDDPILCHVIQNISQFLEKNNYQCDIFRNIIVIKGS